MHLHWRAITRSTTARFIALIFVSQLALTGGILFFVRQSSEATLLSEQKELIAELRDGLIAGYRQGGERQLIGQIAARLREVETHIPVILLTRRDGEILAGNLGAWPTVIPKSTKWQSVILYRTNSDHPEQMGVMTTTLPGGETLLTGHVIDGAARLNRLNREAMFGALLLAIPLALLLAVILARLIAARVRDIAGTAEAVRKGELSHRVKQYHSGDSFDRLGQGMNFMLDRIEMLVTELRIVTDGLAHDLRSPITRIKSVLERAMIDTNDPAALRALESVSAEAETLLAMLSTALQISRAEAGIGRERFTETDIESLLTDLVEVYGPVAEDKGMVISSNVSEKMILPLHRELVSQALGNLIENAVKYAHGGRRIVLSAAPIANGAALSVDDDGPGIPAERFAEARRKFGRLDPARGSSGSGLGLSLVESVARLHGGGIVLEDNAPGLKVVLTIQT